MTWARLWLLNLLLIVGGLIQLLGWGFGEYVLFGLGQAMVIGWFCLLCLWALVVLAKSALRVVGFVWWHLFFARRQASHEETKRQTLEGDDATNPPLAAQIRAIDRSWVRTPFDAGKALSGYIKFVKGCLDLPAKALLWGRKLYFAARRLVFGGKAGRFAGEFFTAPSDTIPELIVFGLGGRALRSIIFGVFFGALFIGLVGLLICMDEICMDEKGYLAQTQLSAFLIDPKSHEIKVWHVLLALVAIPVLLVWSLQLLLIVVIPGIPVLALMVSVEWPLSLFTKKKAEKEILGLLKRTGFSREQLFEVAVSDKEIRGHDDLLHLVSPQLARARTRALRTRKGRLEWTLFEISGNHKAFDMLMWRLANATLDGESEDAVLEFLTCKIVKEEVPRSELCTLLSEAKQELDSSPDYLKPEFTNLKRYEKEPKSARPLLRCRNCSAQQYKGDWEKAMDERARAMGSAGFRNLSAKEQCLKCGSTDLVDAAGPEPPAEEPSQAVLDMAAQFISAARQWDGAHARALRASSMNSDDFRAVLRETNPIEERAVEEVKTLIDEARKTSQLDDVIRLLQRRGERRAVSLMGAYLE